VKDEDIDWIIYHLLTPQGIAAPVDLATKSGFNLQTVNASLQRLEKYFLIELVDGRARLLSVGESLIRCQFTHDADLRYMIENGVIKQKRKGDQ
jgi:Mn-dependent DtxR family transcriptional regulator